MNVEQAIKTLNILLITADEKTVEGQSLKRDLPIVIETLKKTNLNKYKTFEWKKYKRKNGTEFLKLLWYSNEACGWVEVGRFNMSKHEFVKNVWSLNDIYEELEV